MPRTPTDDGQDDGELDEQQEIEAYLGTLVGSYRLTRCIGQGGMGFVFEAIHSESGNRIAIKLMPRWMAARADYRQRFLHEARAGSHVQHPGLVQIFGYGQMPNGIPYIQMEYLVGRLLRAVMSQGEHGQMDIEMTLRITKQLADALAAAHHAGVVHRDLKPENIMLVSDAEAVGGERARILDFGIAKLMRAPDYRTLTGPNQSPIGTPTYMSPEQCRGDQQLDGKTDVYSLGVVVYEMLCGRTPFLSDPQDPMRMVFRHVFDHPLPPDQLRQDLPKPLVSFVLKLLAKAPETRPQMAEVGAECEQLLADPRIRTSADQAGRRSQRGANVAKKRLTMVILVLMLLPVLWFVEFYYAHGEVWWPGRRPGQVRISRARFVMGSTDDERMRVKRSLPKEVSNQGEADALYARESPQRRVRVGSFYIDIYEVSNQRFADWLNREFDGSEIGEENQFILRKRGTRMLSLAYGRIVRSGSEVLVDLYPGPAMGVFWDGQRFQVRSGMGDHPIVQVTWQGARRYCESAKKRLPTEAEWELAARGVEGRTFPWGEARPTCHSAVFDWHDSGLSCSSSMNSPVKIGSRQQDRTPEGVYDLAGNVAEWVFDFYRQRYTPCDTEAMCDNPVVQTDSAIPTELGRHVVRGGSWYREFDALRGAGRSRKTASDLTSDIGFRCVRPIDSP